ncbi:MAG: PTS sugar transporter subunit IIA, partial [Candidatus Omnitrophica bacterium]|nr:PTS sugar transporter subunit IIA [Candidatus Omnitrophota bacterium]
PSLENLEPMLLTCFFTLAGVDIDLKKLSVMGLLGGVYLACRLSGKFIGGTAGAFLGTDLPRIRQNIAMSLLPHAGLAIGLVVILQSDPRIPTEVTSTITNVVLATVVLFEIGGPPLVRQAISRAGESHKDRKRIVEFLQEEHIITPLEADDKWDAIRKLAEFMLKSHGIKDVSVEDMIESIEERERSITTAMGSGVAIPHAKISSGPEIMGAMGICKKGVDFEAPDGQPVQFIIMVATPREHQKQHLQVMAAVARIISDPMVRAKLIVAPTPAAAYEAIESDLPEYYNYFLED